MQSHLMHLNAAEHVISHTNLEGVNNITSYQNSLNRFIVYFFATATASYQTIPDPCGELNLGPKDIPCSVVLPLGRNQDLLLMYQGYNMLALLPVIIIENVY